ncbi:VOC family protein [Cupriavidus plantarum]|uniref:VOC family protein n=1 Tax=Cupriavidus plantarum TaxID=942865 RepID=UPI003140858D
MVVIARIQVNGAQSGAHGARTSLEVLQTVNCDMPGRARQTSAAVTMWTSQVFFARLLWTAYTITSRRTKKEMTMAQIQPYLFFEGRTEEAIEFYKDALGARVEMLMRFRDNPEPPSGEGGCVQKPGSEDKVMHAAFWVGDSLIMASDGNNAGKPEFKGISLSYSVYDKESCEKAFHALSAGGQVVMAPAKTFFSELFAMVTDRFGVTWMILVVPRMP